MKRVSYKWMLIFAAAALAAQDPPPPTDPADQPQARPQESRQGGWRRASDPPQAQQPGPPQSQQPMPDVPPPPQLVVPAGTWITIRVNEPLSSDRNQAQDHFTATLAQPVIADGFVVARRGQMLGGRVAEAIKAGRASGTSRLGLELTELTLASGQQVPLVTQLMEYSGGTSIGRDATAVATTTGAGAAIGAAAAGGVGAAAGAGAGAVASAIGVLVTRGRATMVYPEATLTFRTLSPITINTESAAHAYQPVRREDYETRLQQRSAAPRQPGYPPPYYYYGYSWPYYYSPFYYGFGPSFYWYSGPRFYGGGFRGGFRGRR